MKTTVLTIGLFLSMISCGSSSSSPSVATDAADGDSGTPSPFIAGFSPRAPAANEIQIVSPVYHAVLPGQDITYCSYITNPFTADTDIVGSFGEQSKPGHHAILYDVGSYGTPGDTHECTLDDMERARFLGGASDAAQNFPIPDGVAIRVKAGGHIMIQTHWINTRKEAVDGQAAFDLMALPVSSARQPTQRFATLSTKFSMAAHAPGHIVTECPIQQDLQLFMLIGHEHEFGTHVKIEQVVGGAPTSLYDKDWQPEFQSNAPRNMYTKDAPLVLHKGDTLRVTCDWNNTTDQPLTFPREMCVAFGMYYPATVDLDCTDGSWPTGG